MRIAKGTNLLRHLRNFAMKDFSAAMMLPQVAQYFHGSSKGIRFTAGENIAMPGFQLVKHFQEIPFAPAGRHIQQGKFILEVLREIHLAQFIAQDVL